MPPRPSADLVGELARRHEHQRDGALLGVQLAALGELRPDVRDGRQQVGHRLAAAGRRDAEHVRAWGR
jgi:hypothetical protein